MRTMTSALITLSLIMGALLTLFGGDTAVAGTPVPSVCQGVAARVHVAQDYTGSAIEWACLGQEDDARVGLALDYGMTPDMYRAQERYND